MAATKGNKFWKLRSKHGVDKIFQSPEMLREQCEEYIEQSCETTYEEQQWVGKDAIPVVKNHPRPLTQEGLCLFLGINPKTWYDYGHEESHKDFHPVVTRMNMIFDLQQYELGVTGFHNANLVAMKLGMKAKSEIDVTDNRKDVAKVFDALEDIVLKTEE